MSDEMRERVSLLPCPFCGGEKMLTTTNEFGGFCLTCENCDAVGPPSEYDPEQMREAWNTRSDAALAEIGGVCWHKVEQRLPPVGRPVLVASLRDDGWCVRSACLLVRHEGVSPMPERVAERPTDFWFDAPRGQNDTRLVRPGMMWAETPSPDAAIEPAPVVSVREAARVLLDASLSVQGMNTEDMTPEQERLDNLGRNGWADLRAIAEGKARDE